MVLKLMNINKNPGFPYLMFPLRLEHMDGADMKDKRVCFFEIEENLQKYLDRSNLKPSDYQLYRKEECGKSGQTPSEKKRRSTTRKQTKSQSSEPSSS